MRQTRLGRTTLGVALLLSAATVPRSQASSLTLGAAGHYAVFDYNKNSALNFSGTSQIDGDVALGQGTKYNFAKPAAIDGSLYEDSGVTGTNNGITITGGVHTGVNLAQAVADANTASSTASSLPPTGSLPGGTVNLIAPGQTETFNGQAGQNVVDLTSVNIGSGDKLIINGTSTETFVFNVSGAFNIGSGQIVLSGGVTANHVLFNITGNGSQVNIANVNSEVRGTILAANRIVNLNAATVDGAIISGNGVMIAGGATVIQDPFTSSNAVPEPTSLAMAGVACAFGLGTLACRRRRHRRNLVAAAAL